ncbi:SIMPL domain-containing protein [Actinoplanes sp. NPDC024001]|uniref:SIMPL domain-containing protein n=1 Tax=Actinoplanes sp. NPDC024001 TaxID=3154598 RepID=UPI003403FBE9
MIGTRIAVPLFVALATLVGPSAAWAGVAVEPPPAAQARESVQVTGTGEVFGEPDVLVANFAVETSAATVDAALDSANTAATRMRNALARAGMARADVQTSNVGINPRRNDNEEITGYVVNQGLTAKIRNVPRAGALMSAAIAAGGDAARLNGVSFAIENDAALLAQARKKAFADARGKAELYAREAGRPLGRVVRVVEETPSYGWAGDNYKMAAADAAVPIEPGRQELTVSVTVEWAL